MSLKKITFLLIIFISLENRNCKSTGITVEIDNYEKKLKYNTIEDFESDYNRIKGENILKIDFTEIPINTNKEINFLTKITEELDNQKTRIFLALSKLEASQSLNLFKFMNAHENIELDLRNLQLSQSILQNDENLRELKNYFENFLYKRDFVNSMGFKLLLNPDSLLSIAEEFSQRMDYNSTAIACYKYACAFGNSTALLRLGDFLASEKLGVREYEWEIENFLSNQQDENLENAKILLNQHKGQSYIRDLLKENFPPKDEKAKFILAVTYRKLFYLLKHKFNDEFVYLLEKGAFQTIDEEILRYKEGLDREHYMQDVLRDQAIIYYKEIISNSNSPYWDVTNIYLSVALLQKLKYNISEANFREEILKHLGAVIEKNSFYSFRARFHRAQFYEKEKNYREAERDYKFLANKGHPYAQFELGKLFIKEGDKAKLIKGLKLYEEAAKNDNQYAQFTLGKILYENKINNIPISKELLMQSKIDINTKWMKKAASKGNHWAKHYLYIYYKKQFYSEENEEEKIKIFKKKIKPLITNFKKYSKDHKRSTILDDIGHFYLDYSKYNFLGLDRNKSLKISEEYFKNAIQIDGNSNSKLNLARFHISKDDITAHNIIEAFKLLREVFSKSKDYFMKSSQDVLIKIRDLLKEDFWDLKEARCYFEKNFIGNKDLQILLKTEEVGDLINSFKNKINQEVEYDKILEMNQFFLEAKMLLSQQEDLSEEQVKKVENSLREAAEIGHPGAQCTIALMEDNAEKAQNFIFQSVFQGYPEALYELGIAYLFTPKSFNLKRNSQLSKILCQQAADLAHPEALYHINSAPLFGIYGEKKEKEQVISIIKKLSESGNTFAQEFIKGYKNMSPEDFRELINS